MQSRTAIATKTRTSLEVATISFEGPKYEQILVQIKATGLCHSFTFTLSGEAPEEIFPAILGPKAAFFNDIATGVTKVEKTSKSYCALVCQ